MQPVIPPVVSDLVLIGGGHAHVHVLKMFGMPPLRPLLHQNGIRVTCISNTVLTPYSGMLPGYVAGHYTADEIHVDLQKLCRFAGVRLIVAAATGVSYQRSKNGGGAGGFVTCADGRPPIRFDCLSINVGSAPSAGHWKSDSPTPVVPVKPISKFCAHLDALTDEWKNGVTTSNTTTTISVVGGGAGGIELALALQHRWKQTKSPIQEDHHLQVQLITRGQTVLESHNTRVQEIFRELLEARGIQVLHQAEVTGVEETANNKKRLILSAASSERYKDPIEVDHVVWCITAGAPTWLASNTPLATTDSGFVRVDDTYQAIDHPGVFCAGDCCHFDPSPKPKAGVYAVRAGPILRENLINFLLGNPLEHHKPQSTNLSLISTGDAHAVASRGSWLALSAGWLWPVKDYIDRKWMAMYTTDLPDLETMMASMKMPHGSHAAVARNKGDAVLQAFSSDPMRCGGCGAKVGATTVSRVLNQVHARQVERASKLGKPAPPPIDHDDAAVLPVPRKAAAIVQTIDYFRELVSDPFLFGKIVAVHALSDVHAMGATAVSALSLAVAPFAADEQVTENTLLQLLAGVSDVLQDEEISLSGGHTCEGTELACGLSVTGVVDGPVLRKRGGKVGDCLVLTKRIGTGALFAADMRAKASGVHVQEALASVVQSNQPASQVARDFATTSPSAIHACTDVTGFGLVGHLLEMLLANDSDSKLDRVAAVLRLDKIRFLQGGLAASAAGIYSSLQPQNSRNRRAVLNHSEAAQARPVEYPLLFDPQTAGGLLFFVDPKKCAAFLEALRAQGVTEAHVIGELAALDAPPTSNGTGDRLANGGGDHDLLSDDAVCTIGGGGDSAMSQRIRVEI